MTRRIIRKLLIANRGEIACRISRTARALGIATVAVYSDADSDALHVQQADEARRIGGAAAAESYLNSAAIIEAARQTGADAIHPGYGFLAENANFAQAVIDAGLIFVGPTPEAIAAMGKKREAKLLLRDVPLVPGYQDADQSDDIMQAAAEAIGYPVMVKASAGGGGKGMRRVASATALPDALATARREARQAFGDDTLILEKYLDNPRHIEIQIVGDTHGNVQAVGERECSIQRRHQKIIEETPSTAVDRELREKMAATAVSIGQQLGYVGAGTVEFLLDAEGRYYFMEMNTRLQVEHPVTEMVYPWRDLVALQIRVAEGHPLPPLDMVPHGHAIEARIYAEDPARDFLPATGTIVRWRPPAGEGVRVDDGVRTGDTVSINYDPMIAKVIAWGETRAEAVRRLDYALAQTQLMGLRNNIAFLRRVLMHPAHLAGDISTHFLDAHPELATTDVDTPPAVLIACAIAMAGESQPGLAAWRNNRFRPIRHTLAPVDAASTEPVDVLLTPRSQDVCEAEVAGGTHTVHMSARAVDALTLVIDGHRQHFTLANDGDRWWVHTDGHTHTLDWQTPLPLPGQTAAAAGSLRAPMPGQVIRVEVSAGQHVQQGALLLVLEAMKMEHRIEAPYDGVVGSVHYGVGDTVQADAALLEIEPEAAGEAAATD